MNLIHKYLDSWRKEAPGHPINALWYVLTLVGGVSALVGLSELVLKVKGFALHLLNGYRSIWHGPVHWFGSLLGIAWPRWASDVIALFAVSSAAGYFVVRKVHSEAALSRSRFRAISDDFKAGRLKDGGKLVEALDTSIGDLGADPLAFMTIEWPGYYRFFLPVVIARMYSRDKKTWKAAKATTMHMLNPAGDPEADKLLLAAFSKKTLTTVLILKHYLLWLLAILIGAAALLVISYVLVYVPVRPQGK